MVLHCKSISVSGRSFECLLHRVFHRIVSRFVVESLVSRCIRNRRVGYVRLARKNSPEMLRASQRTTTIFWPSRSCLATVEARRPRRWPLPSMVICFESRSAPFSLPFPVYSIAAKFSKFHPRYVAKLLLYLTEGETHDVLEGRHLVLLFG